MNLVTRIFGFGASFNNESAPTELVKIPSGSFYLSRPGQVRSSRECIYNDAMATIRRASSAEHQFQLVIIRIFEEGEEDILEEDEESTEKVFLVSKELQFRTSTVDGEQSLVWRDPAGDFDEVFEFVATEANKATIDFFVTCVYKAMFERKYRMNADEASEADLAEFVWNDAEHSVDRHDTAPPPDSTLPGKSTFTNEVPSPFTRTMISKPADLYLWDLSSGKFMLEQSVHAKIAETATRYDFWLIAVSDEDNTNVPENQLTSNINPRWTNSNMALMWNSLGADGLLKSWCFKFHDRDDFEEFQAAFSQYLYEHMNAVGWEKAKSDEQAYMKNSFSEDIEMDDPDNSDEESVVESELEPDTEEDEEEGEGSSIPTSNNGDRNSHLTVGYKNDKTFVVRGDKLGIFGRTDDNKVKYLATIKDLGYKGKKSFKPKNIMLHDQDTKMILMNPNEQHSLFSMDIERGKIVDEWKIHDDITVDYIAPTTKFAPTTGEQTLVGGSTNAIFRVDPRVGGRENRGSAMVESKQYAGKTKFSGITTTASGKLAVSGDKGDIRLFDTVGKIAKTALPAMGDPILGIDVTADGRWIVATCKPYLLLIDTLIPEGKYAGSLGFDRAFPANSKPQPKRLQLRGEHAAFMGHEISFTPARFNMGEGKEENAIVTSTGRFVVAWDFTKIKKGKGDSYVIKRYEDDVVQDNFRFGDDNEIIVALSNDVLSIDKKKLQKLPRASLTTPAKRRQSKSSIVNSPF